MSLSFVGVPVLPEYEAPFKPLPMVTPFTIRDGDTLLKKLDHLNKWTQRELIPWVDQNFAGLGDDFETQVNLILTSTNLSLAEMAADINQAVNDVINSSITVQEPVIKGVLENPTSSTRPVINAIADDRAKKILIDTIIDAVTHYGFVGDDITDNTAAWTSLTADVNGSSKTKQIYFRAGSYRVPGNVGLFTKTVSIWGDGPDASQIKAKDGTIGDLITFKVANPATAAVGRSSSLRNITVDGNKSLVPSGDSVVLDAGYCTLDNVHLFNAAGTGLRVGKTQRAIVTKLTNILTRTSRDYGIWVQQDSTDGIWTNVDVGTAGLSGIRLEAAGQNTTNCHTWGCGSRYVDGDASGWWITASGHKFTGGQAESNWEDGFHFDTNDQNGSMMVGCTSWANGWSGVHAKAYTRLTVSACNIYNNGLRNPTGAGIDPQYSGIRNNGSNRLTVIGTHVIDRKTELAYAAPSPVMGRPANVLTQYWDYVDDNNTASFTVVVGNDMTGNVQVLGAQTIWENNRVKNADADIPTITITGAMATIAVRANMKVVKIDGAGSFQNLPAGILGERKTLIFTTVGVSIFQNGNILMPTAFGSAVGKQISLEWNGVKWVEMSRYTPVP